MHLITSVRVLREDLQNFYSGSSNGKAFIADGGKDIVDLGTNTSDMDFKNLQQVVQNACFDKLGIPSVFADNNNKTYNNNASDQLSLYTDTAIPLFNEIMRFLRVIDSRYDIIADISSIGALQRHIAFNLAKASKSNALTINEIRKMSGLVPLKKGGDIILVPQNMEEKDGKS